MNSVVAFHAVSDRQWFDRVIAFLQSRFELLPIDYLQEFYSGGRVRNACHVTVDDGDRSFYDTIFPVLQRRRVHASLFVSPHACASEANFWFQEIADCDQATLRRLAAEQLRVPTSSLRPFRIESICKALPIRRLHEVVRMARRPGTERPQRFQNVTVSQLLEISRSRMVTIGAHTMSHPILSNEDDDSCRYEIGRSVADLTALLGTEVCHFAYPNGIPAVDFTSRDEQVVASAGVALAFSTESTHLSTADSRMRVPRIQISDGESLFRINAKLRWPKSWNLLKQRRPDGEVSERRRLAHVLAHS